MQNSFHFINYGFGLLVKVVQYIISLIRIGNGSFSLFVPDCTVFGSYLQTTLLKISARLGFMRDLPGYLCPPNPALGFLTLTSCMTMEKGYKCVVRTRVFPLFVPLI